MTRKRRKHRKQKKANRKATRSSVVGAVVRVGRLRSEQILTAPQAARILSVNERTIRRWARQGRIKFIPLGPKVIRFRLQDLLGLK